MYYNETLLSFLIYFMKNGVQIALFVCPTGIDILLIYVLQSLFFPEVTICNVNMIKSSFLYNKSKHLIKDDVNNNKNLYLHTIGFKAQCLWDRVLYLILQNTYKVIDF